MIRPTRKSFVTLDSAALGLFVALTLALPLSVLAEKTDNTDVGADGTPPKTLAPADAPPAKATSPTRMKGPVNFIRPREKIPAFAMPAYRGDRYEAMIPDTLDIQERADLAINALTRLTDPEMDHLIYFRVNFTANPPVAGHNKSDICQFKFMESLPLMRLISGSERNLEVDKDWMTTALRTIGPDGLVYWPSFPWGKIPSWGWWGPGPASDQYAIPIFNGRAMGAMTLYMMRDPAGPWRGQIEGVVDALQKLAIHQNDFAYFPEGGFTPGGLRPQRAEMPLGIWATLSGWTTQGLAQFFHGTQYPAAGELATELSHYLRFHGACFGADGEFLPNYPTDAQLASVQLHQPGVFPFTTAPEYKGYTHFQHHMIPMLGLLDTALNTGNREQAEYVRKSFEWAKTKGEITVGYFPEDIDAPERMTSETCEVAGMIGVALKLSAAGVGDYWDDADRWIRNQFAESQLRRSDWIYRFPQAAGGIAQPGRRVPLSEIPPNGEVTTDHVPERCVGAFASWPTANDFFTGQGGGIMNCCTGNGTRAIYYIWENMVTFRNGEFRVNLLLNRPSPWADVLSYIPYEGKVEVQVKQACQLKIRIPEWVQPKDVICSVDQRTQSLTWEGRYAVVGAVTPNQDVLLSFPIEERQVEVTIEKQLYTLTIKGNDVVNIDPPGRYCPFYQRDYYRDNVTRWKKAKRFVSAENVTW